MQRPMRPEGQAIRGRQTSTGRTRARLTSSALPLTLGVTLLVFLVALGSSRSLAHVGGPGDLTREQLVVTDLIALSVGALVIPATLYVIWRFLHGFRGEEEILTSTGSSPEKHLFLQILVLLLLAGMITAFALTRSEHRSTTVRRPAVSSATGGPRTSTLPRKSASAQKTAAALAPWVVGGIYTCLVLFLVAAWVRRRGRNNLPAGAQPIALELESPRRELHELVGSSIAEIEREPDPRRAVIRAYAGMESTLAKHDLGRRPFEAPGEYLSRAFAAMHLSRRPGERLTELFERARFSQHAIGPEMKRESIAALGELRNELEAKPR